MGLPDSDVSLLLVELLTALALAALWFGDRERPYTLWWAISHAALPGIALALLLTSTNNPVILLGGGALAGCIGMLLFMLIKQTTTLKTDTILGIILSVFFGLGLVLITIIQKHRR